MIVVDTNILACRFLASPHSLAADALFRADPAWAAPVLWRSEFRNLLAAYVRKGLLSPAAALESLQRASACLHAGEHHVSDDAVMSLVVSSACSAYDCEFVALARSLGALCYTEDKALLAAFPRDCRRLPRI